MKIRGLRTSLTTLALGLLLGSNQQTAIPSEPKPLYVPPKSKNSQKKERRKARRKA